MPVEATGAWDGDWMLADRLAATRCLVRPVWVNAPLGWRCAPADTVLIVDLVFACLLE